MVLHSQWLSSNLSNSFSLFVFLINIFVFPVKNDLPPVSCATFQVRISSFMGCLASGAGGLYTNELLTGNTSKLEDFVPHLGRCPQYHPSPVKLKHYSEGPTSGASSNTKTLTTTFSSPRATLTTWISSLFKLAEIPSMTDRTREIEAFGSIFIHST